MDSLAASLRAWTPVRVRATTGEIDWALVDGPFAQAFFEEATDRAMRHPFNLAFARRTPLAVLDAVAAGDDALAPSGFVFHMSRCGSTLIAQMLAQLSSTIVLSEPHPLDALLLLRRRGIDDETLVRWLRGMLSALGRPRAGERRLFVKFHAWHVLELPLIVRAFPNVPWAFVFREPRAVLRSQARIAGAEVISGALDPVLFGIAAAEAGAMAPDEYTARVLAAICDAAARHGGLGRATFMEYTCLPDGVFSELLPFFAIAPDHAEAERIRERSRLDAKKRETRFRPHSDDRAASADIDALARRWLDEPYAALREAAARGS